MAENEHNKEKKTGIDFGREEAAAEAQHYVMQIQMLQQQQQAIVAQRQQLEVALAEIEAALGALRESKDEKVYRAVGPIMLRKEKADVEKDLLEMVETTKLRLLTMKKQEEKVKERIKGFTEKLSPILKSAGLE